MILKKKVVSGEIIKCGFKSSKQLYLFMIWREDWECGKVVYASVLFNSKDWIGI